MLAELLTAIFSIKFAFFILLVLVGLLSIFISKQYKLAWWGLFSVDGQKISKGNLAFWIIFAVQIYYWVFEPTTTIAGLQETFLMVLGYCLGTKFNRTANNRLELKSENEKEQIKLESSKRTTEICKDKNVANLISKL